MTLNNRAFTLFLAVVLFLVSCSDSNSNGTCATDPAVATLPSTPTGANVMAVTVNGSTCTFDSSDQYPNEPCVSVTICVPGQTGPTNCQTITNVLLDTGSFGLRLFDSLVTIPLATEMDSGQQVGTCVQYGDHTSEWGRVATADVQLGTETASSVPIQLINQSYATPPSVCDGSSTIPNVTPYDSHYNGILGVGVLHYDCNDALSCESRYFHCSGSGSGSLCSVIDYLALTNAIKVANPVASLTATGDNNGVSITLPSIADNCGIAAAAGYLMLGINTQSNNIPPAGVVAYPADPVAATALSVYGTYSSSAIPALLDTGSTAYFIEQPNDGSLPDCGLTYGDSYSGLLCPTSLSTQNAVFVGNSGSPTANITFNINNAYDLLASNNMVFPNIGTIQEGQVSMDYGLPYFYGKTIYFGISGKATTGLATGPFFAF